MTMFLSAVLQDGVGGTILKDLTPFIDGCEFSTNEHGFDQFSCFVPARLIESFRIYDRPGLPHISIMAGGMTVWEGRLEDPTITGAGIGLRAFGYQNGFRDKRGAYSPTAYSAATSTTIAGDIVTAVNAANSFMSASTMLIGSPGVTWTETYERQTPADILDRLAARGDGVTRWEWGVWEGRMLHFRERGLQGRAWYTDVTALAVARSLEDMWNSVKGQYADTLTAEGADTFSQARYGVKREAVVNTNSDDATLAANARDTFLDFHSDPPARGAIGVPALYDASGTRWPQWAARSGDSITIHNLSPTLSTSVDKIRKFRIAATTYRAQRGQRPQLTLSPELDIPVAV